MGLSVVLCSVNNATAAGGLERIIHVSYRHVGISFFECSLVTEHGKLRKAPNSLQDPPPQVEQIECKLRREESMEEV